MAARLNLARLRKLQGSRTHRTGLSRRQLLRIAATSAVALPPVLSFLKAPRTLRFERRGNALALVVGDREWCIDPGRFAGRPKLLVEEADKRVVLSLRGAEFPGSDLPADFVCVLERFEQSWQMTLRFAFGATFRMSPEKWIASGTPVETTAVLNVLIPSTEHVGIQLQGVYRCTVTPNWELRFQALRAPIRLRLPEGEVEGHSLRLQLAGDAESLLRHPPARRTRWYLEPMPPCSFVPRLHTEADWQVRPIRLRWRSLELESGVSAAGARICALVFHPEEEAALAVVPAAALPGIALRLCKPLLAWMYTTGRTEAFLNAAYDPEWRQWLHTDCGSVEIGAGDGAQPFELLTVNRRLESVRCEPALLRTRLMVEGAESEPTVPATSTPIALVTQPFQGRQLRRPQVVLGREPQLQLPGEVSLTLLRPQDLLFLRLDFFDVQLVGTELRIGRNARLRVTFQPQSIAERAFYEAAPGEQQPGTTEPPSAPPVPARIAGESRLVFRIPQHLGSIPLKLDALLNWSAFEPLVPANALPPPQERVVGAAAQLLAAVTLPTEHLSISPPRVREQIRRPTELPYDSARHLLASSPLFLRLRSLSEQRPPAPAEPRADQTAIELPYRLYLSPHALSGWAHRNRLPQGETVELWHTRLGVRRPDGSVDEDFAPLRTVRAIWSKDYRTPPPSPGDLWPFRTSLTRNDRYQIVELSSNFTRQGYEPNPIDVELLMLTALGAWLRSRGQWEPPAGLTVEEWIHRATLARDHYVRVVYKGFLFPFGHRASLVKVTERKFARTPRGDMAAYLFQRMFIVVREPVKLFPTAGLPGQRFQGRNFPFRRVELRTLVTPNLDDPATTGIAGMGIKAFWPRVAGQDVRFHVVATDWEGRDVEFTLPLVFIQQSRNTPSDVEQIATAYNTDRARRTISLSGALVAYAPPRKAGDTSFETSELVLMATVPPAGTPGLDPQKTPWFYPEMEEATVRLQQVAELLGTSGETRVRLYGDGTKGFLDVGFGPQNAGEVFLELLTPVPMTFSQNTDKAGGLAAPNVKIQALSRLVGPVGANSPFDDFVNGTFDPQKFFDQVLEADLVGSVKLRHILQLLTFAGTAAANAEKIPQLVQQTVYDFVDDVSQLATHIGDTYETTIATLKALPGAVSAAVQTAIAEAEGALSDLKSAAQTLWSNFSTFITNDLGGVKTIRELKEKLEDRVDTTSQQLKQALEDLEQKKKRVEQKLNALKALIEQEEKALKALEKDAREKYRKWKEQVDRWRQGLKLEYTWKTDKLQSWPAGSPIFEVISPPVPQYTWLSLGTRVTKKFDLSPPEVVVEGKLANFKLHLIAGIMEFLQIDFDHVVVSSRNFEKIRVNPKIADIQFKGPLSFVSKLQELVPKGLGGFLPKIELYKNPGIMVSWKLGLPNVTVGVLSITNMALFMKLKVPFVSQPLVLRLAFCERSAPFALTVYVFSGGGFFALELTLAGVQLLEASFEFGAQAALNLGIASGSVGVMAGIYYRMTVQAGANIATLEGYLRMWGKVDVLGGIVTASITIYMSLTWQSNGKVYGQATLTIEVRVTFFSKTFNVKVERQFKGSSGDPAFHQFVPTPAVWEEYCRAFA